MRDNLFRLGTAAIVGSVLFAATACGGDDDKKADEKAAPAASTPLSQEQLTAAVLTAAEMPQGVYKAERDTADDTKATPAECQPLLDLGSPLQGTPKPIADATAAVQVGSADAMRLVSVYAYSFAADRAEEVLTNGRTALAKCATVTGLDADGESGDTAYTEMPHATVGDGSLALGLVPEGGVGAMGAVVVRVGSTLFAVTNYDMAGTTPTLPDDALVQKQLDKMIAASK